MNTTARIQSSSAVVCPECETPAGENCNPLGNHFTRGVAYREGQSEQ